MGREAHVRFWESAGVKFLLATHLPLAPIKAGTSRSAMEFVGKGMHNRYLQRMLSVQMTCLCSTENNGLRWQGTGIEPAERHWTSSSTPSQEAR
jgi:hypothetical protein